MTVGSAGIRIYPLSSAPSAVNSMPKLGPGIALADFPFLEYLTLKKHH
jgi:hypothetical protein